MEAAVFKNLTDVICSICIGDNKTHKDEVEQVISNFTSICTPKLLHDISTDNVLARIATLRAEKERAAPTDKVLYDALVNSIATSCIDEKNKNEKKNKKTESQNKKTESLSIEFIESAIANHIEMYPELLRDLTSDEILNRIKEMEGCYKHMTSLICSILGLCNQVKAEGSIQSHNEKTVGLLNTVSKEVIRTLMNEKDCMFTALPIAERINLFEVAKLKAQKDVENAMGNRGGGEGHHRDEVSSGDQQGREQINAPVVVSKKNDINHDEEDEQNEDEQSKDQGKENGETEYNKTEKSSDTTTENPKTTGGKKKKKSSKPKATQEEKADDEVDRPPPPNLNSVVATEIQEEKADDETEVDNSPLLSLNSFIATEAPKYEELEKKLERLSPGEILAVKETNIVLLLVALLEVLLNPSNPQFARIPELIGDFLTVLSTSSTVNSICVEKATIEAGNAKERLINLHGDGITFGSIGYQLDDEKEEDDMKTLPTELEEVLSKARKAITEVLVDKTIDDDDIDEVVEEFVKLKVGTKNVIANIINLCIGIKFAEDVTIEELYSGLSKDSKEQKKKEFIGRASELANKTGVEFDSSVPALQYLVGVVMPAQHREDESISKLAIAVANDLRKHMCLVGSKQGRGPILRGKYEKAENEKVNSQDSDQDDKKPSGNGVIYCSGLKDAHGKSRNRIISILFNFVMQVEVKKHLPADLFELGYARSILFSSQTYVKTYCNFLDPSKKGDDAFFASVHGNSSKVVKNIKKHIIKSNIDDTGKQNLLLEVDKKKQIASLHKLLVPVVNEDDLSDEDINDID